MIEILTLMLGLTLGSSTVELQVDPEVERVEIRLDGEHLLGLKGPPWRFGVDWGDEILPRELVAIAYDATGDELARDRRWINLRTSESVARLAFPAPDARGRIPHFAIQWASVGLARPTAVRAFFGDQALTAESISQIPLPDYDPRQLHWLSVEVEFGAKGKEILGASLGGENLIELSTELTPVAVEVDSKRAASRLREAILVEGQPAVLHGVEEGPAEVLMVMGQSAVDQLLLLSSWMVKSAQLRGLGLGRQGSLRGQRRRVLTVESRVLEPEERIPALADLGRLGSRAQLRFIWPRVSSWRSTGLSADMFASSPPLAFGEMGLLAATYLGEAPEKKSDFASAVAIAGLAASSSSRRRAVVLLAEDLSSSDAVEVERVVRYLDVLRVPLYVLTLGPEADPGPWPSPRYLGDVSRMQRLQEGLSDALEDVREGLEDQRIVWLEGGYLPQAVSLVQEAKGVRWPRARIDR